MAEIFNRKVKKSPRGIAVILTILILTTILGSVLVLSSIFISEIKVSKDIEKSTIAFYAAESGVERALYDIVQEGKAAAELQNASSKVGEEAEYSAEYSLEVVEEGGVITITSTGKYQGTQRKLEVSIPYPEE